MNKDKSPFPLTQVGPPPIYLIIARRLRLQNSHFRIDGRLLDLLTVNDRRCGDVNGDVNDVNDDVNDDVDGDADNDDDDDVDGDVTIETEDEFLGLITEDKFLGLITEDEFLGLITEDVFLHTYITPLPTVSSVWYKGVR